MAVSNHSNKCLLLFNKRLVSVRKINSFLNPFRFIFLLILLSDQVIGHVSDGTSIKTQSSQITIFNESLTASSLILRKLIEIEMSSQTNSSNIYGSKRSNSTHNPTLDNDTTTKNISLSTSSNEKWSVDSNPLQNMQADSPSEFSSENSENSLLPTSIENNPIFINYTQYTRSNNILWRSSPYIDAVSSPNVTALLGKTAYLTCRVKNLGDKTISWVRHRDIHLLTVGRHTYTTDQRFRAVWPNIDEYTLMIKYPQHRDSGTYECQVSTTPHISHYVHLSVVEPVTEVIGGPDLFIDRGSTINLTCTVRFSPEPPSYIIWHHNNVIISYNSPRGGVSVLTEKGKTTTSYLLIQQAKPTDSGRYSCNPSNAVPHSIVVHVLNGELPAAMHTGGQMSKGIPLSLCLVYTVVVIFVTS